MNLFKLHISVRASFKHLLVVAIVLGTTFYACEPDDSIDPTVTRQDYLGQWIGASDGPIGGPINFTMNIIASGSSGDGIRMENFDGYGQGTYVSATVSAGNITIPRNVIGSDTIQGSGSYRSDGTLSFNYTIRDGQSVDQRTATATR